jgi:hypothetical protein
MVIRLDSPPPGGGWGVWLIGGLRGMALEVQDFGIGAEYGGIVGFPVAPGGKQ